MMKNIFLLACLLGSAATLQAKRMENTRQTREARTMALDSLSQTLQHRFISEQTIEDGYDWIEETMDPRTHKRLLELQAEAEQLYEQRRALLLMDGVCEKHDLVKVIDKKLYQVEKELDDLIYNGGALHWKTLFAVGAGAGLGFWAAKAQPNGVFGPLSWLTGTSGNTTGQRVGRGIAHGLLFAVMLEYMLRGRRSVIGGNIYRLIKFVAKVIAKVFSKVFGQAGLADKLGAFLEDLLRPAGKVLDKMFNGAAGPVMAVGVTALLVGGALHFTRRRQQA